MRRRDWLLGGCATLAGGWPWAAGAVAAAEAGAAPPVRRFALTWREAGPAAPADGGYRAGVLRLDLGAPALDLVHAVALPGRAHGLVALPDGGSLVVANRPGRWLLRTDAAGRALAWHRLDDERPARTLNGHAEVDADGRWLFTTETDPATGDGWVSVRDARTLARVLQWPTHGTDPHQALLDADGGLVVANGGIARWPDGRKRAEAPVQAALVRLDARDGRLLGRWTLPDPALSIRHLAWAHPLATAPGRAPGLGIALQAEHARPDQRRVAPLLALWDGERLAVPAARVDPAWQGYAGDIAAAPAGGFVLSGQKAHQALWWRPDAPDQLQRVADWTDVCAVAAVDAEAWGAPGLAGGVLVGGARGLALWQARGPARAWPWPGPWQPDNHLVPLADTA